MIKTLYSIPKTLLDNYLKLIMFEKIYFKIIFFKYH